MEMGDGISPMMMGRISGRTLNPFGLRIPRFSHHQTKKKREILFIYAFYIYLILVSSGKIEIKIKRVYPAVDKKKGPAATTTPLYTSDQK